MFCMKCGAPLVEEDVFCRNCGAEVNRTSTQQSSNNSAVQSQQGYMSTNSSVRSIRRKKKKKDTMTNLMIGGCAFVAIASVFIIVILIKSGTTSQVVFEGDYGEVSGNTGLDGNSANEEIYIKNNNITNNSGASASYDPSSLAVKFKGFTFRIPTSMVYQTNNNSILLEDVNGRWATYIEVLEGSYDVIQTQKSQLQAIYQNQGYTSGNPSEKNIGGVNFITLEVSKAGNNALLGISNANSSYFFGTTVYDSENKFDYDILNTISTVLNSAVYNSDTNNISTFDNPDLSEISGIAR